VTKIIFIANNFNSIRIFRRNLILNLSKNNEVFLFLPKCDEKYISEFYNLGVRKVFLLRKDSFRSPILFFYSYKKIKELIVKIKPDKVLSFTIFPNLIVGFLSNYFNFNFYPYITGLGFAFNNGTILKFIAIQLYKLSFKKTKYAFFENTFNKTLFIKYKIIKFNQGIVLNGAGVDLEHFKFCQYPNQMTKTNILFIGRIMKDKGIRELLYLVNKTNPSLVNFTLIGTIYKKYNKVIHKLIQYKKINYVSFVDDVRPYIIDSHLLVLPSYHEGMANVLLEAASMGRPLIASNIPGCKEAIKPGYNGYLFVKKNKFDFYNKVQEFLNLKYEMKALMGFNSRNHIASLFSKDLVVTENIKYLNLL